MEYYLITKHGENDYSVWFTTDLTDENQGSSVRGTLADIKHELATVLNGEVA